MTTPAPQVVKVRLMGTPEAVAALAARLAAVPGLTVTDQSAPYPNRRGSGVRVYLDTLTGQTPTPAPAAPPVAAHNPALQAAATATPEAIPLEIPDPDSP